MSKKIEFLVACPTGIHIKPLTILVNEANRFASQCDFIYDHRIANLKSIMGVLAISVPYNAQVTIQIDGDDEEIAYEGIKKVLREQKLM